MSLHENQLKILQILSSTNMAGSGQVAEVSGLSVEAVRYYLKILWDEGYIKCSESPDYRGDMDYYCYIENKGKVAVEDLNLLVRSSKVSVNQTTITAETIGFVQSGNGSVSDFVQNINQSIDEISRLIDSLRQMAQSFPEAQREEALVHLDDLREDIATPEKQKPQRIKVRIAALVAIASVVAGAADFANNVVELSDKLGVPIDVNVPHLIERLPVLKPNQP